MLSKTIETLKYLLLEYRFYFLSIALLFALLIYNYSAALALKKEHTRINKELHLIQVTYGKRQKTHNELTHQRRTELERLVKELSVEK
ncbi:hypothetical protein H4V97_003158 [Flavobacterium sp. CG_23.5]|uniref:hypothetical protein n=1 Tax=Flavobacterium sp. CG_23.5 TaxID=2760708 RepID=UPI001AE820D5|nr:hypothetical protein [Flavobacterium sp. CG_23.5]MBP2284840.1 hypothetical protein [Flavobacterium sp. CG_23.5]